MSGNRIVTIGGGALLAGAGYYFYKAGGDPKVAQKKVEGMSLSVPSSWPNRR
jgi:hypothetical protein